MASQLSTRLLYPDPFEPSGVLIELEHDAVVSVALTDFSGNTLSVPLSRTLLVKGTHQILVDRRQLSEQNLYLRIIAEADGQTITEVKKLK